MDAIDRALFEAWGRVCEMLKSNPKKLARRRRRLGRKEMRGVPRACCLAVRASDHRITGWNAVLLPEGEQIDEEAWEGELVVVSGYLIRKLCKPVEIPWPGVPWYEAATMLGVDKMMVEAWVRRGKFEVRYVPASTLGHGGRPVPVVWRRGRMDPGFNHAQGPERVWGSGWTSRWEHVPEEYEQEIRRWRVWRTRRGKLVFRGWQWECPGRMDEEGNFVRCGRRSHTLYMPVPVWTVGKAMGAENPLGVEVEEAWGRRTLACRHCWGMVHLTWTEPRHAWNTLVRYFSGGVLYGREVPMPEGVMEGAARTKG
ncbi:MAG: hypothetical protein IT442_01355 [Phycisphaeraceae bacterium]|nr:hypothetical protein [Phycisphaeraceae bacterium]